MPSEIIGEIIGGVIEVTLEVVLTEKKPKYGCFIALVVAFAIIGALIYYNY